MFLLFPIVGYWIALFYLIIGAVMDIASRGVSISSKYLNGGLVLGVLYLGYELVWSTIAFPVMLIWALILTASVILALFMYRTGLLGHADIYVFVAVAFLAPGITLPSFILGSLIAITLSILLSVGINVKRHTFHLPDSLLAVRLTPRLLSIPSLSWTRAYDDDGKLVMVLDIEHASLVNAPGQYAVPALPFLPFFALALFVLIILAASNISIPFLMSAFW